MRNNILVILFLFSLGVNLASSLSIFLEEILPSETQVQNNSASFHTFEELCEFIDQKRIDGCCYLLRIEGEIIENDNVTSDDCLNDKLGQNSDKIKGISIVNATFPESLLMLIHVEELQVEHVHNISNKLFQSAGFLQTLKRLSLVDVNLDILEDKEGFFQKMADVRSLRISQDTFLRLDLGIFANNKNLSRIDLSENKIMESLTISADFLKQLVFFNASGSNLSSIEIHRGESDASGSLQTVDLSKNKLKYLPDVFCNAFSENAKVLLTDNSWDKDSCSFYPLWKVLFTNDNAQIGFKETKPNLLTCDWSTCPTGCTCHEEQKLVNCSHRGLTSIPDIGPSEAETLILSYNSFGHEISTWMQKAVSWCNIRSLYLEGINLTQIFDGKRDLFGSCECQNAAGRHCILPQLRKLSLASNQFAGFTKHDWRLMRNIESLNLSRNRIHGISFTGDLHAGDFSTTRYLDLSYNMQTKFRKQDAILFPYLRELNLSHNQLKEFDFSVVSILPELTTLDMGFNSIKSATVPYINKDEPYSTFVPYLENLYLHENKLERMMSSPWRSLKIMSLYGNPWKCSRNNTKNMMEILWRNPQAGVSNSVRDWKCYQPDIPKEEQELTPFTKQNLFIVILCFVFFICLLLIFTYPLKQCFVNAKRRFRRQASLKKLQNLGKIEYDVFIFQSEEDENFTEEKIVPYLEDRHYKVSYPRRDYILGYAAENMINMISSSRKMLVVISSDFLNHHKYHWCLQQSLTEEMHRPDFKVRPFLIKPYIEESTCPNLLVRNLLLRDSIKSEDLNRFEKLERFLGAPMEATPLEDQQQTAELTASREEICNTHNHERDQNFQEYDNTVYQVDEGIALPELNAV